MTSFRPKLWTGVSAAIVLGAAGLAACSGEGGEAGGEAKTAAVAPAAGEGGEGGAEGGPGGEAGAQAAYVGVPAESRVALRLAHLKGFFLIAQKQTDVNEASALAGQGMLEVFDAQPDAFRATGVDEAKLRAAASSGSAADLTAALAAIEAAQAKAGGDQAAVAKGMISIASGLYAGVVTADGVDPIEYQHSYGAAMAAKQAVEAAVKAKPALAPAQAEMAKFLALWPAVAAPKTPTPPAQVAGQAARVELSLS